MRLGRSMLVETRERQESWTWSRSKSCGNLASKKPSQTTYTSAPRASSRCSEAFMSRSGLAILHVLICSPAFAQPKGDKIDFAHDVVPILKAKCAGCHTNGTYKGGLSLDTRASMLKAKAVVPGKAAES